MTAIPKALQEHINTAYPAHVCLIGTVLPNGYAQVTPRGSRPDSRNGGLRK